MQFTPTSIELQSADVVKISSDGKVVSLETVIFNDAIDGTDYTYGAVEMTASELDDLLAVLSVARGCIKP